MNQQELETLNSTQDHPRLISSNDLVNKEPRTLLYGYTCNRDTWHVYLDEHQDIHVVTYNSRHLMLSHTSGTAGGVTENSGFLPDKRLYPESCDFEFCRLLVKEREDLPFTNYDPETHGKRTAKSIYDGLTAADLRPSALLWADEAGTELIPEAVRAAIGQACIELDALHEADRYGDAVRVEVGQIDAVRARAQQLIATEAFRRVSARMDELHGLARCTRSLLPFTGRLLDEKVSARGGLLQVEVDVDGGLDFNRLTSEGFAVTAIRDTVHRARKDDEELVFVQHSGSASGAAKVFVFARLFGTPDAFERVLRPYLSI